MMNDRKSVQGGYCDLPDRAGCALTPQECDDPSNFRSSRQMRDAPVRGHGGECRWQDSVRTGSILGMCFESDSTTAIDCAPTAEGCSEWDLARGFAELSRGFVARVPECTVETTSFGRCSDGMCAWSPENCGDDDNNTAWTPFDVECTCDRVRVGACSREITRDGQKGREVFCAVSEDACDAEQSWIPARDVNSMVGFDCYLCREESLPPNQSGGGGAMEASSYTPETDPLGSGGGDLLDDAGTGGGGTTSHHRTTTIIAVVGTGAFFALVICGVIGARFLARRRAAASAAEKMKKDRPPLSDIQIPSETDCEAVNNPSVDTDNASVLSDGSYEEERR